MGRLRRFVAELERRRLLAALGLYGAVSLAAWGGVDLAVQAFSLPGSLLRAVIVASLFGLPFVVAGSWLLRVGGEPGAPGGRTSGRWRAPRAAGLGIGAGVVAFVLMAVLPGDARPGDAPSTTIRFRFEGWHHPPLPGGFVAPVEHVFLTPALEPPWFHRDTLHQLVQDARNEAVTAVRLDESSLRVGRNASAVWFVLEGSTANQTAIARYLSGLEAHPSLSDMRLRSSSGEPVAPGEPRGAR